MNGFLEHFNTMSPTILVVKSQPSSTPGTCLPAPSNHRPLWSKGPPNISPQLIFQELQLFVHKLPHPRCPASLTTKRPKSSVSFPIHSPEEGRDRLKTRDPAAQCVAAPQGTLNSRVSPGPTLRCSRNKQKTTPRVRPSHCVELLI